MYKTLIIFIILLSSSIAQAQFCSDKYLSVEISYIVARNASEYGDPMLFRGSGVCELKKRSYLFPDEVKVSHQSHIFTGQPFNDRRESTYESVDFIWKIGKNK